MNGTVAISDARTNLSSLVNRVAEELSRVTISVHGKVKAVVLSLEELESLEETAEILAIPGARESILEGEAQAKRGEGVLLSEL